MANHRLIHPYAPGFWGGNIHARIHAERVTDKVVSLNLDKEMAMAMPYALWQEPSNVISNSVTCSCFKDTSKQADVQCLSCYGTGLIPGYLKFGTKNYWVSSIDVGWTSSNIILDKTNRPFRMQLTPGNVIGIATSAPVPVSLTGKIGDWETRVEGFTRDGSVASGLSVTISGDGGTTFVPLAQIDSFIDPAYFIFRVTMIRTTAAIRSPMFEMARIRFQSITDIRKELSEPIVRFIPTWDRESEVRGNHGIRTEVSGKRFWCMPLAYFDPAMAELDSKSRIIDDSFVEARYGAHVGIRYAMTDFAFSDTFDGRFTRQEFGLRRYVGTPGGIGGEMAYRVF